MLQYSNCYGKLGVFLLCAMLGATNALQLSAHFGGCCRRQYQFSCSIWGIEVCCKKKFSCVTKPQQYLWIVSQQKHLLEELVNSGLYGTKDSFAVVIQPALQVPPKDKVREYVLRTVFSLVSSSPQNVPPVFRNSTVLCF